MAKIDELLEFWNNKNKGIFSQDRKDFLKSKNFASGNGFYEVDSKEWSAQRAKVYADFINPVVSGIVAMLELAPPEIVNFDFDRKLLSDVLREMLQDGKSFILAYNKGASLKIKKVSNLQTYINEDFTKAIHVSKITSKEAEAKGAKFASADQLLIESFKSILDIGAKENYLLTFYEKTAEGVDVSEFVGKEQVGKTATLHGMRHLPIIAFFGELTQVGNRANYRGIYYKAKDILKQISFLMSFIQERIATSPNVLFLVAEESIGGNNQQWQELNGEPKSMLTYKSRDTLSSDEKGFPPPTRVDQSLQITEALLALDKNLEMLRGIMGGDMAGEGKSHETAESVLLRREKKDASGNAYIRSLLSSLDTLAEVLTDYYALLGQQLECTVVDRYFVKMKQNRDRDTILSLMQIAEKSPAFASALAEKTDLDAETQQKVIAAVNVQNLLTQAQLWQQQLQQSTALIQNLQQQVQNLSNQNIALEASKREQVEAAQIRAQVDIQRTLIQNETELLKLRMQEKENAVDVQLEMEKMNQRAFEAITKLVTKE